LYVGDGNAWLRAARTWGLAWILIM